MSGKSNDEGDGEGKFMYEVMKTNFNEYDLDTLTSDDPEEGFFISPEDSGKMGIKTRGRYGRTESQPAQPTKRANYFSALNDNSVNESFPLVPKSGVTKKPNAFNRIFSNPSFTTITHDNSFASIASVQRSAQKIQYDKVEESHTTITKTMNNGNNTNHSSIRHTRMTPAYNNKDILHKSETNHVTIGPKEIRGLPVNYVDPGGKYPAKEAYIQSIKTQFFGLGFWVGSSLQ